MSSPKSFAAVEDPEALRRRAEELIRQEQARHDALSGTSRDLLSEEDRALCERVEERNRAIDAINAQQCALLRAQAADLHAKLEQAAKTRTAVVAQAEGLTVPAIPKALEDIELSTNDPLVLQSALEQLKLAMEKYEVGFARARQEYSASINQGRMHGDAVVVAGHACYASELDMLADAEEQRAVGQVKAQLRRQRAEADELVTGASRGRLVPLSAQTLETYREVISSANVGERSARLQALREQIRDDARLHRLAQADRERLDAERTAIDKQLVLADVCRQMGWRVIVGKGAQADRIYVSERGFANHLRELRLEQDGSGKSRLSLQTVEIVGARSRVGNPQRLREEQRDFEMAMCGKGGSLLEMMNLLRDNAISLKDMKNENPPEPEPFALAKLPADLRAGLTGQSKAEELALSAKLPSKPKR